MSQAPIHFPEKRGGWNAHRLENAPENLTVMVAEKSKMRKNTHFFKCALSFLFLINHLACVRQTPVQNGL